jgi:hypothetical protein
VEECFLLFQTYTFERDKLNTILWAGKWKTLQPPLLPISLLENSLSVTNMTKNRLVLWSGRAKFSLGTDVWVQEFFLLP